MRSHYPLKTCERKRMDSTIWARSFARRTNWRSLWWWPLPRMVRVQSWHEYEVHSTSIMRTHTSLLEEKTLHLNWTATLTIQEWFSPRELALSITHNIGKTLLQLDMEALSEHVRTFSVQAKALYVNSSKECDQNLCMHILSKSTSLLSLIILAFMLRLKKGSLKTLRAFRWSIGICRTKPLVGCHRSGNCSELKAGPLKGSFNSPSQTRKWPLRLWYVTWGYTRITFASAKWTRVIAAMQSRRPSLSFRAADWLLASLKVILYCMRTFIASVTLRPVLAVSCWE